VAHDEPGHVTMAASLGKMATTSVRCWISPLSRSNGLVEWSCCEGSLGEGHGGEHVILGLVCQLELGESELVAAQCVHSATSESAWAYLRIASAASPCAAAAGPGSSTVTPAHAAATHRSWPAQTGPPTAGMSARSPQHLGPA
jgi:hypothetical protein